MSSLSLSWVAHIDDIGGGVIVIGGCIDNAGGGERWWSPLSLP